MRWAQNGELQDKEHRRGYGQMGSLRMFVVTSEAHKRETWGERWCRLVTCAIGSRKDAVGRAKLGQGAVVGNWSRG